MKKLLLYSCLTIFSVSIFAQTTIDKGIINLSLSIPSGAGSVTSVGLALPSQLTITGSPVTTTGTLTGVWADTLANYIFAGPAAGGVGTPQFRFLVAADLPAHNQAWSTITSTPTTLLGYSILDTKANFSTQLSDGSFMFIGDAPTSHATSHLSSGGDAISLFNTTSTVSGLVPGSNSVGSTYYINANGTWSVPAGGGGATIFTDLTDVPANYTDAAYQLLRVNGAENAVEFSAEYDYDTTKWYFANDGDNANNGHTEATPKLGTAFIQNFPSICGVTPEAGDFLLFKSGDTFRFRNNGGDGPWKWIGTEDAPITITFYEEGAKPRMLGSDTITNWINHSGNIWKGYKSVFDDYTTDSQVWFETLTDSIFWGNNQTQVSNVDSLYECYYSNDTVYIYSESDPSTAFASVEIPLARYTFLSLSYADSAEHYVIDGLEVAYTRQDLISNYSPGGAPSGRELRGLEVRNCEIHHCREPNGSQGYGILTNMSDVIVEDNEIHNCGRRGISIEANNSFNSDTVENILGQRNHLHHGFHSHLDIINNGASGTVFDNIIFRNNIVEDDPTIEDFDVNNMAEFVIAQTAGAEEVHIKRLWIYNNLFKYCTQTGVHIVLNTGNASNTIEDVYLIHNVFDDYATNLAGGDSEGLIRIDSTNGSFVNVNVKNNITYSSITDGKHVVLSDSYTGVGTTLDYNLHYSSTSSALMFVYGGTDYTQAEWLDWKTATGWEADSPTPADPLFKNPPDSLKVYLNSPADKAGVYIPGYTHDYDRVPVSVPPNIGAFEKVITIDHNRLKNYAAAEHYDLSGDTHEWTTTNDINADTVFADIFMGGMQLFLQTSNAEIVLSAAQCNNAIHINNDNDVISFALPDASLCIKKAVIFKNRYAQVITVETADGDVLILYDTALTSGDATDSVGVIGEILTLVAVDANTWMTVQDVGPWVDGGTE